MDPNDTKWKQLRDLLLEKTDAKRLEWTPGSHCHYFECSLGDGLKGRSYKDEFLLVDDAGDTVWQRRLQCDGDMHVYEAARASAMKAEEQINEALVWLDKLR